MYSWKDTSQYEHLKSGKVSREVWCWEFMRRNEDYHSDFEDAQTSDKYTYEPPKESNETDNHWRTRVALSDGDPLKLSPNAFYSRKWKMRQVLQKPQENSPPTFLRPFPQEVIWEELGKFYHAVSGDAPVTPLSGFVTMVFDLELSVDEQLNIAKSMLKKKQDSEQIKDAKYVQFTWYLYLRVFDAKQAGAKPKEIIVTLDEYKNLDNDQSNAYQVSKKVGVHYKTAKKLISYPLTVLGY